ncbi:MAG: tetratricopeptide repeat protein [Ignavibacteria bacterium]|nr:tetratricopeptide repeat protein [Ignavibacteria bacterium]
MKISLLALTFFLLYSKPIISQDFSPFEVKVRKGIDYIYNIKFDSAEVVFKDLMSSYPSHPAGRFFLAMVDWWRIALDYDNESYDEKFFAKLEDVIFHCDQMLKKNEKDVNALFFKGGAIGFRGRLRAVRESWIKAADDGREALPLLKLVYSIDSTNQDILFGMGIYNYFASVIPDRYPYIKPLMIFFPKGDKTTGLNQLIDASKKAKYSSTEAMYFLLTLYYQFEEDFYEARDYAEKLIKKYPDNPIFQRYYGRTYVRLGDYENASFVFKDVYLKSKNGFDGYGLNARREALYYMGIYFRHIAKYDSAIIFLNESIDVSKQIDKKGDESGFQTSAVLNLGLAYDQSKNREKAVETYKYCLSIKDWNNSHDLAKMYLENAYGSK